MKKRIRGYMGYIIADTGEITRNGKAIAQTANSRGYDKVTIYDATGKRKRVAVHRLVALAFVPNPHGLPVVNHIDGDKHNNRADNLEWVTHSENSRKYLAVKHRHRLPVIKSSPDGEELGIYISIREAALRHGYDYRGLYEAVVNQTMYKGYSWRRVEAV